MYQHKESPIDKIGLYQDIPHVGLMGGKAMPGHNTVGSELLIGIRRSAYGGLTGIALNSQTKVEVIVAVIEELW